MPKKSNKSFWGGRGRPNNPEEKNSYFGHDDRTARPNNDTNTNNFSKNMKYKPRVSFKRQHYKNDKNKVLKAQFDDDVVMPAGSNNNYRQGISRGRGKGFVRGRNSQMPMRSIAISESNWYKVIIPYAEKLDKVFILNTLLRHITPCSFTPIMYKMVGNEAIFYVEDHRVATKLAECDKKITMADGYKLQVKVRPGVPPVEISDALKERLKQAMGKRYVAETNALDLSKFYHDPELAPDYWCPLARPNMLMAVLDIVQKHIPHLEALNLDSNKLANIEKLSLLSSKFEKLKILYIGDNKIKEMNYLNVLKNLPLEELRIAGNPVCNKYRNRQDDYVSDIRKTFPKLLKLDGVELPPPIVFDVEDDKIKLPPTQRMFIVGSNAKAQEVASQFLQQYFMVFDSDNRQPLLDAYHEHACFSMTVTVSQSSSKFSQYFGESRNLCRVLDTNRRRKLLKQGRLPVVSFISEMPRTKHDLASFTMDVSLVTDGMMLISVTGLFKELYKDNKEHLRFFHRTFIIVPEGGGFCISNEQLHINNPTQAQEKQFECAPPIAQPTPGPSTAPEPNVSAVPLTEEMKQQMTMSLSQQTNMNIEWSLKCLEEVQWNFDNARAAFHEAYKLGKIPPTAFNK